jgi:transposase
MAALQPHKSNYWEHPNITDWDAFAVQVEHLCELHGQTQQLAAEGTHVISVDEKTGVQALERESATLPMREGKGERREFNYIRHGTQVFTGNLDLASGEMVAPTISDTRTEEDFLGHIEQTIATAPADTWIFLMDQLNTHKSASLVGYVAEQIQDAQDLGVKGKSGILKSMDSRMRYLSDQSHRIRVEYTPKHCSWLNPIEVWFSILSSKVLRRGNFSSITILKQKILDFIKYFNAKCAHAFSWSVVTKADVKAMLKKIYPTVGVFSG